MGNRYFNCNYSFIFDSLQYTIESVQYGVLYGNEQGSLYFANTAPSQKLYVTLLDGILDVFKHSAQYPEIVYDDLKHLLTYYPNKNSNLELQIYKDATYSTNIDSYGDLKIDCYAKFGKYSSMYSIGDYISYNPDLFANGTIHKMAIFLNEPYWGYIS